MLAAQSCLTFCNPLGCNLPDSSVHGIFQGRILEWVAISFSGDLPNPGIQPRSPALQADSLTFEEPGKPLLHTPHEKYPASIQDCLIKTIEYFPSPISRLAARVAHPLTSLTY